MDFSSADGKILRSKTSSAAQNDNFRLCVILSEAKNLKIQHIKKPPQKRRLFFLF